MSECLSVSRNLYFDISRKASKSSFWKQPIPTLHSSKNKFKCCFDQIEVTKELYQIDISKDQDLKNKYLQ